MFEPTNPQDQLHLLPSGSPTADTSKYVFPAFFIHRGIEEAVVKKEAGGASLTIRTLKPVSANCSYFIML
jgi:hypothetical protein